MIELEAVARVRNSRKEITDDFWGGIVSEIELDEKFSEASLQGIEEFSHLEIIFHLDKADEDKIISGARHPRNNPNWPEVGVFAQRGKSRPNRLGLTIVKLIKKERRSLFVSGLDAIDGTPVLDIKPVVREYIPTETIKQPKWVSELMENYWKE